MVACLGKDRPRCRVGPLWALPERLSPSWAGLRRSPAKASSLARPVAVRWLCLRICSQTTCRSDSSPKAAAGTCRNHTCPSPSSPLAVIVTLRATRRRGSRKTGRTMASTRKPACPCLPRQSSGAARPSSRQAARRTVLNNSQPDNDHRARPANNSQKGVSCRASDPINLSKVNYGNMISRTVRLISVTRACSLACGTGSGAVVMQMDPSRKARTAWPSRRMPMGTTLQWPA